MQTACAAAAAADADMKSSLKVSLGGAAAALGLVLMFMTSLIPVGTYAFPAFAGMLLVVIVIELNYVFALSVYAVTALLAFLFVTDKEAALLYAVFLGYYPVIKSLIERIRLRPIQYVIKLAVFNATMIGAFYIALYLLSIPSESFNINGVYLPWLFLLIGNATFIVYDICITRIVILYMQKWHNRFNKNTKL